MPDEPKKDAKTEIDEAADALKELVDDRQLPFKRWLIKLLVEKVFAPILVPAVTAAATAATGWYVVGQYQVKDQVKQEVRTREDVRELVDDATRPGAAGDDPVLQPEPEAPSVDALRERWNERYPNRPFPEDVAQQQLQKR